MNKPLLSIIIVNYNATELLKECIKGLLEYDNHLFEIIVVDNSSKDFDLKENDTRLKVIRLKKNIGYSRANNLGFEKSKGTTLFFLNPDTRVDSDNFQKIFNLIQNRNLGNKIIGLRNLNANGDIIISFGKFPTICVEFFRKIKFWLSRKFPHFYSGTFLEKIKVGKQVDWVSGAALLMTRKRFEEIGKFDQEYFIFFEDVDLCKLNVDINGKNIFYPQISITHYVGTSAAKNPKTMWHYRNSQTRYYRKHNSRLSNWLLSLYLKICCSN